MNFLENIFSWRVPSLDDNNGFGPMYLFFTLLTIAIIFFIIFKVKDHSEKKVKWIVFGFGVLFFVLELFKQLFHNVFDGWDGYVWHIFPFQLCSTPLYFALLSVLFPQHIRQKFYSYLAFVSFLGGISVMLFPRTVASEEVLLFADSLIWHDAMIVLSIYLIVTQGYGKIVKETFPAIFIFVVLALMAMGMNYIFEICKQAGYVEGSFNMFMISPYYECNSPIISDIYRATNWYVVWIVYYTAITAGILVYWCIIHGITRLVKSREMSDA